MPICPDVRVVIIRGTGVIIINTLASADNEEVIII